MLFTLDLSLQIMELARTAGLRGAISKDKITHQAAPWDIRGVAEVVWRRC